MNDPVNLVLNIVLEDEQREIAVPENIVVDATPLLEKMDDDMDHGWQIGRRFSESPGTIERCQVAADRLLSALHTDNQASITLMACYILARLEGVSAVYINAHGEPDQTLFYNQENVLISSKP
jgi:hypothetical protein